ncbi:diphthamide biosynthesis protein [Cystobasidium minutum MCA 4210]|uniref:diphthamide biosynthesis protein n=1 Tax=Cystobasidium minutum MCA 4210 TaxID=1397322 RepID=UPI0034CE4299|eukprot:jgi/Rhomi1/43876/CE43875_206
MDAPGPSTTSTVSASGVEAIETTIEVTPQVQISEAPLEEVYEVERTVNEILRGGWTKICLQFPDELLHDSVPVFQAIRANLPDNVELYVMADTTYGSCCVDEVAAQHVDADFVVHYGHACLSAPARLPVLYIFPKAPMDVEKAVNRLEGQISDNKDALEGRTCFLLLCDVAYYYQLANVSKALQGRLPKNVTLVTSQIDTDSFLAQPAKSGRINTSTRTPQKGTNGSSSCCHGSAPNEQDKSCCNTDSTGCCSSQRQVPPPPPAQEAGSSQQQSSCRKYNLPAGRTFSEDVCILYIGPESLTLTNLLLTHSSTPVISYDPMNDSGRLESGRTNKLLMKRYGVVQKARDADVFGIVVGTLGIASYLPTLEYLRKLLKKHKKKSYTMAVGKLTPAKLGNFLEVETWVLVACGENSLVEGYKDFMKPIVTPWELEVALGEREWITGGGEKGQYTLDFQSVLHDSRKEDGTDSAEARKNVENEDGNESDDPDAPVFSTVTGQYRYRRTYGSKEDVKDTATLDAKVQALAIRNQESALSTALSSAGGEYLATRIYKGLDPRYGLDAPSVIEQGRSGIARQYEGDTEAAGASGRG